MVKKQRNACIDDGCNPEIVEGAEFDGYFGIPIIKKPKKLIVPSNIVPFTKRGQISEKKTAIGFYEMDDQFSDILISPEKYLEEFTGNIMITPDNPQIVLSPDCSLYRNAPLAVQITNVYRNRAIGFYYQHRGVYVVPQVRWGNELTYTTKILPEKIAFLGVEKAWHSGYWHIWLQ